MVNITESQIFDDIPQEAKRDFADGGAKAKAIAEYFRLQVKDHLDSYKKQPNEQSRRAIERLQHSEQIKDIDDFIRKTSELIAALLAAEMYIQLKDSRTRTQKINQSHIRRVTTESTHDWLKQSGDEIHIDDLEKEVREHLEENIENDPQMFQYFFSALYDKIIITRNARHMLNGLFMSEGMYVFGRAQDLHAEVLMNPLTRVEYAPTLFKRHERRNRAKEFTLAVLERHKGNAAPFDKLVIEILTDGMFVETHPESTFHERATDPRYVITRASGRPPLRPLDPAKGVQYTKHVRDGADIQIWMPHPHMQQTPVVPMPKEGDEYFSGRRFAETIEKVPFTAGLITDMGVDPDCDHSGFASKARAAAFDYIRKEHPHVSMLVGEVFEIVGIESGDGKTKIELDFPISNAPSFLVNLQKGEFKNRAILGWKRKNCNVPVTLDDGRQFSILLNWYALIHPLR